MMKVPSLFRPGGGGLFVAAKRVRPEAKRIAFSRNDGPQHDARLAAVSPDGKWLAYTSDETNRTEIYIRPIEVGATGKVQVSTEGGTQPVWSRDGKTI
jgi:Tol biopolymer transport system component